MMMKFLAFFLLVAASVGIVTAQNDGILCPQVCKSVPCGPEGLLVEVCAPKAVNGKCTWSCPPLTCAQQGRGCATMRCSTGGCVDDPVTCIGTCTTPPPVQCLINPCENAAREGLCPLEFCTPDYSVGCNFKCSKPDMCIQGGAPPAECSGEGEYEWDNKACKWICKICTEKCTAKCSAGQTCVFDKTCTPTCKSSTANTCLLNDGNSRVVSGGRYYQQCNQCTCMNGQGACTKMGCPEGPFNNDGKPVPPPTCHNFRGIACPDDSWECVTNPCTMDVCIPERAGTCVKKTTCLNCAVTNCGFNPDYQCVTDPITNCGACVNVKTTPTPAPMCNVFRGIACPDDSWECVTNPCTMDVCIPERAGTCVKKTTPKICTEKCTAKCFAGQTCVFDKTCTPTCKSSTANTCLLNDGISSIVSGGKYYNQCNQCTCGGNGQPGVCTEIACEDGKYNNDGTLVPPPVCTEKCTKDCPFGQSCVFDKTCTPTCRTSTANTCVLNDGLSRVVSGGRYYQQCNQCTCMNGQGACTRKGCPDSSVWNNDGTVPDILPQACFVDCQIKGGCRTICQYPISFKVSYTGTIKQLATKLVKVATDARIAASLVVIDNTQLVKKPATSSWECRIAIKSTRGDTSNRDKYITQLKQSFTGGVTILENGENNNDIELDSEIETEPLGDAQPFTTQTCADDTTIAASASCPAITEEGMIIPTATSSSSSSFPLAIVIGSVVGGVIALVILTAAIIIIQRRRTANKVVARTSAEQEMTNTV